MSCDGGGDASLKTVSVIYILWSLLLCTGSFLQLRRAGTTPVGAGLLTVIGFSGPHGLQQHGTGRARSWLTGSRRGLRAGGTWAWIAPLHVDLLD